MSYTIPQPVLTDCRKYAKSLIEFNNLNTFNNVDKKVKKQFEDAVEAYAKAFCEKHGLQYAGSYWVGDEVGGLLSLEERMIDFSVIRYDLDNDVPAGMFDEWDEYCDRIMDIENRYSILYNPDRTQGLLRHINYPSWCKGAPTYSESELDSMETEISQMEDVWM